MTEHQNPNEQDSAALAFLDQCCGAYLQRLVSGGDRIAAEVLQQKIVATLRYVAERLKKE